MEYTKGRWKQGKRHTDTIYMADENTRIATCFSPNAEANAHLIVAAPDMYEALKKLPEPKSLLAEAAYTGGDVPKSWIRDKGYWNDGYNQALKDIARMREQALAKADEK